MILKEEARSAPFLRRLADLNTRTRTRAHAHTSRRDLTLYDITLLWVAAASRALAAPARLASPRLVGEGVGHTGQGSPRTGSRQPLAPSPYAHGSPPLPRALRPLPSTRRKAPTRPHLPLGRARPPRGNRPTSARPPSPPAAPTASKPT